MAGEGLPPRPPLRLLRQLAGQPPAATSAAKVGYPTAPETERPLLPQGETTCNPATLRTQGKKKIGVNQYSVDRPAC